MAWNEPGNGEDPWKKNGHSPNDLDRIVQNWQRKLSGIIGGGRGTPSGGSAGAFRTKYCSKYPSLLPSSTTNDPAFRLKLSMAISTYASACLSHVSE
jgi:hypothetical protein